MIHFPVARRGMLDEVTYILWSDLYSIVYR